MMIIMVIAIIIIKYNKNFKTFYFEVKAYMLVSF